MNKEELKQILRLYGEDAESDHSEVVERLRAKLKALREKHGADIERQAMAQTARPQQDAVLAEDSLRLEPPAMLADLQGSQQTFANLQVDLIRFERECREAAEAAALASEPPPLTLASRQAREALEAAGMLAAGKPRAAILAYLEAGAGGSGSTVLDAGVQRALTQLDAQLMACYDMLLEDVPSKVLDRWAAEPDLFGEAEIRNIRSDLYGSCQFPLLLPRAVPAEPELPMTCQRRQFVIERVTQGAAVREYMEAKRQMEKDGRAADAGASKKVWLHWVKAMAATISKLREGGRTLIKGPASNGQKMLLDPDMEPELLAVITCHTMLNLIFLPVFRRKDEELGDGRVPFVTAVVSVGDAVELEQCFRSAAKQPKSREASVLRASAMAAVRNRSRLSREEHKVSHTVPLGGALVDLLVECATVEVDPGALSTRELEGLGLLKPGDTQRPKAGGPRVRVKAFMHNLDSDGKRTVGYVGLQPFARDLMDLSEASIMSFVAPKYQPMVVPPRPWKPSGHHPEGGYLLHLVPFIRTPNQMLTNLKAYKPYRVSAVMDQLGRTPWRVNLPILEALQKVHKLDLAIAEVPPREDPQLPEFPENYESLSEAERKSLKLRRHNAQKRRQELQSERPTFELKLKVAQDFMHAERLYFPHNVDFRGRTYPIPPHLSHIGDDVCRGLLMFAEPKPLGEEGVFWQKVCLANLLGKNKVSFEDRVAYVDSCKDWILAVAKDPLDPMHRDRWATADDGPWQTLARCMELAEVWGREDGGRGLLSHLPIHLDGTCNGLQHYAALGRDEAGGRAVNLCPSDKPQDVYTVVLEIVKKRVFADAARPPMPPAAIDDMDDKQKKKAAQDPAIMAQKIIEMGALQRKVVKQTIMTICYGVTTLGARHQVLGQLEDIAGDTMDPHELNLLAGYLSQQVLRSIDEVFERAMRIKTWFDTISGQLSRLEVPTSWVSPIGLACAQPYKKARKVQVITKRQRVTLMDEDGPSVDKARQRMGFPPNFIHSLDASHMMMVAEGCRREGISFAGVHDSFWTHAADAPALNRIIRKAFVDLHSRPILEELYEDLRVHLGGIDPPPLPQQGSLDIMQALHSRYIFG